MDEEDTVAIYVCCNLNKSDTSAISVRRKSLLVAGRSRVMVDFFFSGRGRNFLFGVFLERNRVHDYMVKQ